jgi:hypothetical protein
MYYFTMLLTYWMYYYTFYYYTSFFFKKKILQSIRVMFLKSFRSAAKVKWEKRQSPGITLECLKS